MGVQLLAGEEERLDGINLWPQLVDSDDADPDRTRDADKDADVRQRQEVLYNIDPIGLPPPVWNQATCFDILYELERLHAPLVVIVSSRIDTAGWLLSVYVRVRTCGRMSAIASTD